MDMGENPNTLMPVSGRTETELLLRLVNDSGQVCRHSVIHVAFFCKPL